jgi:hypothetical protein
MVISSKTVFPHAPFWIVHLNTNVPVLRFEIVVVGDVGVLIDAPPGPLT